MEKRNIWCGEYSPSQNSFNVDLLDDVLEKNIRSAVKVTNPTSDWLVCAIGTRESVDKTLDLILEELKHKGVW